MMSNDSWQMLVAALMVKLGSDHIELSLAEINSDHGGRVLFLSERGGLLHVSMLDEETANAAVEAYYQEAH